MIGKRMRHLSLPPLSISLLGHQPMVFCAEWRVIHKHFNPSLKPSKSLHNFDTACFLLQKFFYGSLVFLFCSRNYALFYYKPFPFLKAKTFFFYSTNLWRNTFFQESVAQLANHIKVFKMLKWEDELEPEGW